MKIYYMSDWRRPCDTPADLVRRIDRMYNEIRAQLAELATTNDHALARGVNHVTVR